MLTYKQVCEIIAVFPYLSGVWNQKYVFEDSQGGFKQPWLNALADDPNDILTNLKKLDGYLRIISQCPGYKKLRPGLRARNIEEFRSTLAEVKTDVWIAINNTLEEIRPPLPCSKGEGDFKLTLAGKVVYGEVWEARDLPSSKISDDPMPIYMTDQCTEQPKRIRTLRQKGYSQLPPNVIGIWVAHIYHAILTRTFVDTFIQDMANRSNVLGAALWVRAGSKRFSPPCIRCRALADEGYDIYWLDNERCEHKYLQRKFLCSIID